MSRNPHQIRLAPLGMNTELDLPQLPADRSRFMRGFRHGRHGHLRLAHLLNHLRQTDIGSDIIGHAWFNSSQLVPSYERRAGSLNRSRLLVWRPDFSMDVYELQPVGEWPAFTAIHRVHVVDPVGEERTGIDYRDDIQVRIRSVQIGNEMYWCPSFGGSIRRTAQLDDGRLVTYRAGISIPHYGWAQPARYPHTVDDGTWDNVTAPISYAITFLDERMFWGEVRESDLSAAFTCDTVPSTGDRQPFNAVRLSFSWPDDPQVQGALVYRAASGTTDYYRIKLYDAAGDEVGGSSEWPYIDGVIKREPQQVAVFDLYDITSESDLLLRPTGPARGRNLPPRPASILGVHNHRLLADDTSYVVDDDDQPYSFIQYRNRLQISALDGPTQWSVSNDGDATGGTLLEVGERPDMPITGILSLGGIGGIWLADSRYLLHGTSILDWTLQLVNHRGCIAPDSLVEGDGAVLWLSDDGVYAMGYTEGFSETCVSEDIRSLFTGYEAGSRMSDGSVVE